MKKIKWLVLAAAICAMALCLVGCGSQEQSGQQQEAKDNGLSVASTTDGVIEDIQNDFKKTKEGILGKEAEAKSTAGDSYESYIAGKDAITDWYASTKESSEQLMDRTEKNAVAYYKVVAAGANGKSYSDIKDEMMKFYRAIYEDEMKNIYRDIYQDAMKDMYDTYVWRSPPICIWQG